MPSNFSIYATTPTVATNVTAAATFIPSPPMQDYSIERYARVNLGDSLSTTQAWLPVAVIMGHYQQDAIERYFERHPTTPGGRYRVLRNDEFGVHGDEFDVVTRSAPTIKRLRDMRGAAEAA